MADGTTVTDQMPSRFLDYENASDATLLANGVPPRPSDPSQLALWRESFEQTTAVPSVPCVDADSSGGILSPDPNSQHFWSGQVNVAPSGNAYNTIWADVTTPRQYAVCAHASKHVIWTGLGGWNNSQLIQNGIDASGDLHHWSAWWEMISPTSDTAIVHFSGFSVHEGDRMRFGTFYDSTTSKAYMFVINLTTGQRVEHVRLSYGSYSGATAEVVDEAPGRNSPYQYAEDPGLYSSNPYGWFYLRKTSQTRWTNIVRFLSNLNTGTETGAEGNYYIADLTNARGTVREQGSPSSDATTDFWLHC